MKDKVENKILSAIDVLGIDLFMNIVKQWGYIPKDKQKTRKILKEKLEALRKAKASRD